MEQRLLTIISIFRNAYLAISIACMTSSMLASCKEPMLEHPEYSDPVWVDIGNDKKASESGLETERKDLDEAKKSLNESPVHDPIRGQLKREISKHERKVVEFEQRALYYKIELEKRKFWDESVYPKRYEADLPWPDATEVAKYKKMKALRTASMNWGDRVPKTTRYSKQQPTVAEKPKAEHGE